MPSVIPNASNSEPEHVFDQPTLEMVQDCVLKMSVEMKKLAALTAIPKPPNPLYAERNKVLALAAKLALVLGWKVEMWRHEGSDWDDDWRNIVAIELPTGQVTWHIHDSELFLFSGIPSVENQWDGHTTENKYERVVDFLQIPEWQHFSVRETLADAAHQIWAHWMKYQFSICTLNADGSLTIPADKVQRWQRQFLTDYALLSDSERESDREQADKILALLTKPF